VARQHLPVHVHEALRRGRVSCAVLGDLYRYAPHSGPAAC
jgi:hypothetical protein